MKEASSYREKVLQIFVLPQLNSDYLNPKP